MQYNFNFTIKLANQLKLTALTFNYIHNVADTVINPDFKLILIGMIFFYKWNRNAFEVKMACFKVSEEIMKVHAIDKSILRELCRGENQSTISLSRKG